MDIYLTELETNDRLRFPMLPQEISAQMSNEFYSYSIMQIGEIKMPSGSSLDGFSWSGILPGKARENAPFVREWRDPQAIYKWIERLKPKGVTMRKLRLLITETPINCDVYLESFTGRPTGGFGDINYQINFIQAKDIIITVHSGSGGSGSAAPLANTPPQERPSPPQPKTRIIVSGDTLWGIAQRYYGSGAQYTRIYDANREAIEAEAKRRGRTGSNHGHWIYPGTVLTIS